MLENIREWDKIILFPELFTSALLSRSRRRPSRASSRVRSASRPQSFRARSRATASTRSLGSTCGTSASITPTARVTESGPTSTFTRGPWASENDLIRMTPACRWLNVEFLVNSIFQVDAFVILLYEFIVLCLKVLNYKSIVDFRSM